MLLGPHGRFTLLINGYDIFYICYTKCISMKDLCYVYTTAVLSVFLIKSIRATECCTKYLRYVYTTTILYTILVTTAILSTFLMKNIRELLTSLKRYYNEGQKQGSSSIMCKKL